MLIICKCEYNGYLFLVTSKNLKLTSKTLALTKNIHMYSLFHFMPIDLISTHLAFKSNTLNQVLSS